MEFSIPGAPVAKARPRFSRRGGFVMTYRPSKEVAAEARLRAFVQEQMRNQHLEMLPAGAPLVVSCEFDFAPPKSWGKRRKLGCLGQPHISKPDLDNLIKFVLDALNGVVWADDRQVAAYGECVKLWTETPMTRITVETLQEVTHE